MNAKLAVGYYVYLRPYFFAMMIFILAVAVAILGVYAFIKSPRFGRPPVGIRLELIKKSPNYRDGSFQNLSHTPALTEGETYSSVMKKFFFGKKPRRIPLKEIPHVQTNLHALDPNEDVLVWFGHSSYFMQIDGRKILVDPVLSGAASPIPSTTKAFKGADIYKPADIPEIDYLFLSHDHWDHLDYKTMLELKPKIRTIICSLGTGEHLHRWGFDMGNVIEKDWNQQIVLEEGFVVNTAPARHFSGRGFKRNLAMWTSYVLQTPTMKIYIGGDSGYDTHFAEIGKMFGPFDLALLENGQYDKSWKYIHMTPEEVLQAAKELGAKRLIPVHSGKFALGNHPWDEPLKRITAANKTLGLNVATPMIGEKLMLEDSGQRFKEWWVGVE